MIGFILGAGFSVNAGLPTVTGISKRFTDIPLDKHVLKFSSGEWKWDEWQNATGIHNGKLGGGRMQLCMVMDLVIQCFLSEHQTKTLQYEEFYEYLKRILHDRSKMDSFIHQANHKYLDDHPYLLRYNLLDENQSLQVFNNIPASEFHSSFFHLIADLLDIHVPTQDFINNYDPFIGILKRSGFNAEIFSLNHDLLVEIILDYHGIPFSTGFTATDSALYDDDGTIIPVFRNSFGDNIRLQKLHGGLNIYRYDYVMDDNRHLDHDYFQTNGFYAKQVANHIFGGKKVQNFTADIMPQFITGSNKLSVIRSDGMYNSLHERFRAKLKELSELYIIGYSYGDTYLNEIIGESATGINMVVNVNPYDQFKFTHSNMHQLADIRELIQFA